jgi:hypothetical protein
MWILPIKVADVFALFIGRYFGVFVIIAALFKKF